MLPYQQEEDEIRAKDATAESIRRRQYLTWLNWRNKYPPLASLMMKHSANVLHDHRESISRGRAHIFAEKPVMGAAA